MDSPETYQRKLWEEIRFANRATPISSAAEAAYYETPRHQFVTRYRRTGSKEWLEVNAENLVSHLPALYTNRPLILAGEDDGDIASTISQPSLVLRMLDMLRVEPGHRVFELGAGSGWNAALLSRLTGPTGHVYSVEILADVARRAAAAVEGLGISHVSIVEADGGAGYAAGAPYDRAIFTAGTYDIPRYFYQQIKEGGLLLAVIKSAGGGDCLFLLRKSGDHFESMESLSCAFVQMTGKYRVEELDSMWLEQAPEWPALRARELGRTAFWWGGKGPETFVWRTWGIRSFLGITEPLFQAFHTGKAAGAPHEEEYFGLWDRLAKSLVVAREDALTSYGSPAAREQLERDLVRWVELGMPASASFELQVFPSGAPLHARGNQWIIRRNESQFVWGLPG